MPSTDLDEFIKALDKIDRKQEDKPTLPLAVITAIKCALYAWSNWDLTAEDVVSQRTAYNMCRLLRQLYRQNKDIREIVDATGHWNNDDTFDPAKRPEEFAETHADALLGA